MSISEAIIYVNAREYGTHRPCEIGRIEEDDGCVTLAFRYTDEEGEWFPTWVGPKECVVKVPPGWSLSEEMLAALAEAIEDLNEAEGPVAADPSNAEMPASPDKEKDKSACSQP